MRKNPEYTDQDKFTPVLLNAPISLSNHEGDTGFPKDSTFAQPDSERTVFDRHYGGVRAHFGDGGFFSTP